MILIIIVLVLIGALASLATITWIKDDNEVKAMFDTIVVILLCILICKVFEC